MTKLLSSTAPLARFRVLTSFMVCFNVTGHIWPRGRKPAKHGDDGVGMMVDTQRERVRAASVDVPVFRVRSDLDLLARVGPRLAPLTYALLPPLADRGAGQTHRKDCT